MPDGSAPDGAHREAHGDRITKRQTGETPRRNGLPPRCVLLGFDRCRRNRYSRLPPHGSHARHTSRGARMGGLTLPQGTYRRRRSHPPRPPFSIPTAQADRVDRHLLGVDVLAWARCWSDRGSKLNRLHDAADHPCHGPETAHFLTHTDHDVGCSYCDHDPSLRRILLKVSAPSASSVLPPMSEGAAHPSSPNSMARF